MSKSNPLPPIDHPGTFVLEAMNAHEWSQADLADILGIDESQLNSLIKGNIDITPDTAWRLARVFDMSADFFLNLQTMYNLKKAIDQRDKRDAGLEE